MVLPSIEARFGRIVTAPSATSSSSAIGELFAPQLSEPTNRKCPVRLARPAASRTHLSKEMGEVKRKSCHYTVEMDENTRQNPVTVVSLCH